MNVKHSVNLIMGGLSEIIGTVEKSRRESWKLKQ
jgi:hypothetical protein